MGEAAVMAGDQEKLITQEALLQAAEGLLTPQVAQQLWDRIQTTAPLKPAATDLDDGSEQGDGSGRALNGPEHQEGASPVGFVGLEHAGGVLAQRLHVAGFPRVLYHRNKAVAKGLVRAAGDIVAATVSSVATQAKVVCVWLKDEAQIDQLVLAANGLFSKLKPGQIVIDFSQVSPATTMRCHNACAARGAMFIDAPLAIRPTDDGSFKDPLILVGCCNEAFEAAQEVLSAVSSHVVHVGGAGCGTAANLATQLYWNSQSLIACEALYLGHSLGLPREKEWLSAALGTPSDSEILQLANLAVTAGAESNDDGALFLHQRQGRPVEMAAESMQFVCAAAEGMELGMPVAEVVRASLDIAMDRGLESSGLTVLYHLLHDGSLPVPRLVRPPPAVGRKEQFPNPANGLPVSPPHRWQR